jgi:tetratricopeptide (TPR) repeat protein
MMFFRRRLLEMVVGWDIATRVAFGIGVVVLALMFVVLQVGGDDLRLPAIVGISTALLVLQGLALWGNRWMVTPFTQAQRYYRAGDFEKVVLILEGRATADNVEAAELTLLGNTYRQIGELSKSEGVLSKAVDISPDSYFPRYGFGRTLLVMGNYAGASIALEVALELGAPPAVRVDLAEALYRAGRGDAVAAQLALSPDDLEPQREVMRAHLAGEIPPDVELEAGLLYWTETARRFNDTPYGAALWDDIREIEAKSKGAESCS